MEDIHNAKVYINERYRNNYYVCLEEFYDKIGVGYLDPDYTYGWSSVDGAYLYDKDSIEINVEPVGEIRGEKNVYVLTMPWEPSRDYLL